MKEEHKTLFKTLGLLVAGLLLILGGLLLVLAGASLTYRMGTVNMLNIFERVGVIIISFIIIVINAAIIYTILKIAWEAWRDKD